MVGSFVAVSQGECNRVLIHVAHAHDHQDATRSKDPTSGAPGITSNKKLLVTKGVATRSGALLALLLVTRRPNSLSLSL